MTQPTTPNATPGKSIYLDGMIYEDIDDAFMPLIIGWMAYLKGSPKVNKYLCPPPHNFTNYQDVTGLYVKQWQWLRRDIWSECTEEQYNTYSPTSRRIIALPIQNDNKEGGKDIKTDWLEKKKLFDEIEQRLINKVTSMDDIELLDIFNEWMNLRNGLNTNWIEYIKQKLNNITNK